MPTPKQVVYTPVDFEDGEYVDIERDPKMEEENAEFEQFKSEMHDAQFDAKITVGKKLTDSSGRPMGRQIFECFECGVDDYTFSQLCTRIREDFGTGLYQIQGRDSKGKYKFKKTVGILAPNTPDNKPAGQDVGALIDKMSDAMQRQQMATEQMFLKLAGPQTGGDAIDQIVKISAAVAPILTALGISRPEPPTPPKTLMEQLAEFKMIKELFGEGEGGLGGEANLYSLLGDTIKAFGGPIAQALAAGAASGELTETGIVANPALPAPKDETMKTQNDANVEMRKNIHILIQNAKAKVDPAQFALILVNNTPADKEDALWEFISADNCVDEIVKLEPVAGEYRQWFVELRNEVIDLMSEPEDLVGPETDPLRDLHEPLDDVPGKEIAEADNGTDLITGKPLTDEEPTSEDLQTGANAPTLDSVASTGAPVAGAESVVDTDELAPDESSKPADDGDAASDTDGERGNQGDA